MFINVNICKKLNVYLKVFCCFLTDFAWSKKWALFRNNRIQHISENANNLFSTAIASDSVLV